MKMKTLIYTTALLMTIGIPTLLYTEDNKNTHIEVCPVVGKAEETFEFSEYKHCTSCGIGVFLSDNNEVVRCSHCRQRAK